MAFLEFEGEVFARTSLLKKRCVVAVGVWLLSRQLNADEDLLFVLDLVRTKVAHLLPEEHRRRRASLAKAVSDKEVEGSAGGGMAEGALSSLGVSESPVLAFADLGAFAVSARCPATGCVLPSVLSVRDPVEPGQVDCAKLLRL